MKYANKEIRHALYLLTAPLLCQTAGATILTFSGLTDAPEVTQTYGDYVNSTSDATGSYLQGNGFTPNIEVTYSHEHGGTPGNTGWLNYSNAEWPGVTYIRTGSGTTNADDSGRIFDLTLTPDAGYEVILNSFDYDDYANYAAGHTIDWILYKDVAGGDVLDSGTGFTIPANADGTINVSSSYHDGAVVLRIIHQSGAGNDLALDNINFDQRQIPTGATDPALCTADVPGGLVGSPTVISVQARDVNGYPQPIGGDTVTGSVSGANTSALTFTDNGDGTYSASYFPVDAGTDSVAIDVNGSPLANSPFTSQVLEGSYLKVLTYNVRIAGNYGWADWRKDQTVAAIQASGAEVVGLQEIMDIQYINELRDAMGWAYSVASPNGEQGIISKYPIIEDLAGPYGSGARIILPSGKEVYHYNIHVSLQHTWSTHYLPYAANSGNYSEQDIIYYGYENWDENVSPTQLGTSIQNVTTAVNQAIPTGNPVFLTGDFNEPSHLDWTQAAFNAGVRPMKVNMPLSQEMEALGFIDSFREVRPDEVNDWGHTWTPKGDSILDRIDFVEYQGTGASCIGSKVVGESAAMADIVVSPWASDHRAVVSNFYIDSTVGPLTFFWDDFTDGDLAGWSTTGTVINSASIANARLKKNANMTITVDTSSAASVGIVYDRLTKNLDNGEFLTVEWSANGSNWNTVESTSTTTLGTTSVTLPAGAAGQAALQLRFRLNANRNNESADIDNVFIRRL